MILFCNIITWSDELFDHGNVQRIKFRHSMVVRSAINRWWNVLPETSSNVSEMLNATRLPNKSTFSDKVKDAIMEAYCWVMWKGRNDVVFNGKCFNPLIAANDIQSVVYSWVRYRCRKGVSISWYDWACNPELLL